MRFLRSWLFVLWLYGFMTIFGIGMLPLLALPRPFTQAAIGWYAQTILIGLKLICGIDTEIRGQENLPRGALIYAGKHHCMLDIFIPFIVTRDPMHVMKDTLLWTPALGWYAMKCKMIAIDRDGTAKTLKKMLRAAQAGKAEGRQIIIFPEGTRMAPGALPDYKPAGISAFNKALDLPITLVATNAGLCWPASGATRTPGRIVYEILPPLPAGLDRKSLMARLETELETASNRLIEEGRAEQARRTNGA
jgi:1-acyl-sn-glycerol-3-phosphate acyltransferase